MPRYEVSYKVWYPGRVFVEAETEDEAFEMVEHFPLRCLPAEERAVQVEVTNAVEMD